MYYEINVTKDGSHHFATAERSIRDEDKARWVLDDIKTRFPEWDGFKVTCTYYETVGKKFNPLA